MLMVKNQAANSQDHRNGEERAGDAPRGVRQLQQRDQVFIALAQLELFNIRRWRFPLWARAIAKLLTPIYVSFPWMTSCDGSVPLYYRPHDPPTASDVDSFLCLP